MAQFVIVPKTNERLALDNFIKDYSKYIWDNQIVTEDTNLAPTECMNILYKITYGKEVK